MLVSRNPCGPNNTPNLPNASRLNIGHIWSPRIGSRVGHVDFKLFGSFHLRPVANANAVSGGIWAYGDFVLALGEKTHGILSWEKVTFFCMMIYIFLINK